MAAGVTRVSDQMRVNTLINTIRSNQLQSGIVQQQLATGDRLLTPSTDPDAANQAMSLQRMMGLYEQVTANLDKMHSMFDATDDALSKIAEQLRQAESEASASIDATAEQRAGSAGILQAIIDSLVMLGNTKVGDTFIFAGAACTAPAFSGELDGVCCIGNSAPRLADLGGVRRTPVGLTGTEVFDIESRGVRCYRDLTPAMTVDTQLADLCGAGSEGIRLDVIEIDDGTNTVRVDLTGSDRVGDILDKINDAGGGVITAAIAPSGTSLQISSTAGGADLTVRETGTGWAAHDLGIFRDTGQGAGFVGDNVRPRITDVTLLADLAGGAGVDQTSGLTITNGGASATLAFDADVTVGDLLARINDADLGVLGRINEFGDGIDILNQISGSELRIAENGGATADDLGVRSLRGATKLDELRDGRGVWRVEGVTDIRITARDGGAFEVDLSGAETMDDVVAAVNAAAIAAGVNVAAAIKTVGNGIELTDTTGGAGNLAVQSINNSTAAENLGMAQSVAADTLASDDVHGIRAGGVFTHLIQLRDALMADDTAEITRIAGKLYDDEKHVVGLQARMGGVVQDLTNRAERNAELLIDHESMLSGLKDTDYAEAITQFQALQSALQANLLTSSIMLNMSLLDFLR